MLFDRLKDLSDVVFNFATQHKAFLKTAFGDLSVESSSGCFMNQTEIHYLGRKACLQKARGAAAKDLRWS